MECRKIVVNKHKIPVVIDKRRNNKIFTVLVSGKSSCQTLRRAKSKKDYVKVGTICILKKNISLKVEKMQKPEIS